MSQVHTCEGPSASSSGLTLAGWVAWRRRSRLWPAARVAADNGQALTQDERQAVLSLINTEAYADLSFVLGQGLTVVRRHPGRAWTMHASAGVAVVTGPGPADQHAGPHDADPGGAQLGERGAHRLVDDDVAAVLSEICSKSAL